VRVFWSFSTGFVIICRFCQGRLGNFKFKYYLKKAVKENISRVSASCPLRHSNSAWGTMRWPKSCFHHSFRSGASFFFQWCNMCSRKRFGWVIVEVFFFFFSIFSLSFPRKTHLNLKKNNCILWFVVLSILVLLLLITIYLAFNDFWSLDFFQFDFLSDLVPLLFITRFFCFILFLIMFFFFAISSHLILLHLFF
jgi:hypothetical protein